MNSPDNAELKTAFFNAFSSSASDEASPDANHSEPDVLIPSSELETLAGTLLLAINARIEADASLAALSLAEWRQWLDDEGYPIDQAIEQFGAQVSPPFDAELQALAAEITAHLEQPDGLAVLTSLIDAQPPSVADCLHDFIDRALTEARQAYSLAGGANNKVVIGGTVGGVAALATGAIIYYKVRKNRLAKEAAAAELEKHAKEAFQETEQQLTDRANAFYRHISRRGNEAIREVLANPRDVKAFLLSHPSMADARRDHRLDNISLSLKKNAKALADHEIKFHVESYSKGLAKKALGFMETNDERAFNAALDSYKPAIKAGLLGEVGRPILQGEAEDGVRRYLVASGREINLPHFNLQIDADELRADLPVLAELEGEAKAVACKKMERFFIGHFRDVIHDAFRVAKNSEDAEIARIDVSIGEAYARATAAIKNDWRRLERRENEVQKDIRRLITTDVNAMERRAGEAIEGAVDDFELIIEDA